jgi:[ribosomal protein S5]-alanine N-acetyltransferase
MQALVTARLRLEPQTAAHAEALYPMLADPRQCEFLDHGPPDSLDALRERFRKLESRRSGDGREHWLNWVLIPHDAAMQAIGFVQATVQEDHRAWVAYQVACERWGQGLGTEATRAMVEHLIVHYGAVSCMATVDARNERSRRLLERLGFQEATANETRAADVAPGDRLFILPT